MAGSLDDSLKNIRDRRTEAVREQSVWSWRYMEAIGVANGAGLVSVGTMLGAAGFAEHAVRGLSIPAGFFLLGLLAYSCGPLSRWFHARASAERFNQEERAFLLLYSRDDVTGAWNPAPSKVAEGKQHFDQSKTFDGRALLAMLFSWAATAVAGTAWIVGVVCLVAAINSGGLRNVATPASAPPAKSAPAQSVVSPPAPPKSVAHAAPPKGAAP